MIGKVYSLAGRVEEALPYLTRATADCGVLYAPFRHISAHYHLGMALEGKGDTRGACAAYQVVLDHWGNAKPRSLTAEKARARSKALDCKA
jgi:serine/threonine-protein kinase